LLNPGFNLWTVAQDSSGQTLIVDGDKRLLRREGSRFVPIPLRPGTARGLWSLTVDPAGTIWIYSSELGLLRLAGDSLIQVDPLEDLYHTGTPFSDSKGRIWVGQANRAALYSGGKLTRYEKKQGINGFVYGFFEDRDGTIWAATGDGLSKFTGDRFRTLTRKEGIPGATVMGMAQDETGAWWLATLPGILRFPPGEIEHMVADSTYVPRFRTFDESDGMVGALVKGYYGSVLVKSGDGRIWVTTDSGLAVIDPAHLPDALPPPVSLEVTRIAGREMAIADAAELPPRLADLEIDYTSLTFSTPERVRFRYRLVGADTSWHDVGVRRRAYFTQLAPGSYRFEVTAGYEDGAWNETGASWSFRVLPAWYQTLWFKAAVVLLVGGLIAAATALVQRGRHRRVQQALRKEYEATLAERARIAQDLHDTLLQGFAGVTLQLKAAELALPEEPDVAAETILRVQQLARESLREARERVWDMRETELGGDDLLAALEAIARERTSGTGIEVSVVSAGQRRRLTRSLEEAAFRIGREAVVNAVRHAEAHRVEIHLDFGPTLLRLEIHDDGRGFTPADAESARRNGHFGLSGMHQRAAHLGGRCEVRPRPGGGSVVVLELPLKDTVTP
jgi:signal transduction histidine kinase